MRMLFGFLAVAGLVAIAYVAGVPQRLAVLAITRDLSVRQGLRAGIGNLSLEASDRILIRDFVLYDRDGSSVMIRLDEVKVAFEPSRLLQGVKAVDTVVLKGGVIRADLLSRFRRRSPAGSERSGSGGSDRSGGDPGGRGPGRSTEASSTGSPRGGEVTAPPGKDDAADAARIPLNVEFHDLVLDGGTRHLNFLGIVKRDIRMKVDGLDGRIIIRGKDLYIERLSWRLVGTLKPTLKGVHVDLDAVREGRIPKGIPRELRGLLIAVWILLGGRAGAS